MACRNIIAARPAIMKRPRRAGQASADLTIYLFLQRQRDDQEQEQETHTKPFHLGSQGRLELSSPFPPPGKAGLAISVRQASTCISNTHLQSSGAQQVQESEAPGRSSLPINRKRVLPSIADLVRV